jgi:hypothetical protein
VVDFVHARFDADLDGRQQKLAQQPTPAGRKEKDEHQSAEGSHGLSS